MDGESTIDPSVTTRFLESRDSVLFAEVWTVGCELHARVVVDSCSNIHEDDLMQACVQEIGVTYTPQSITLERAISPAA